MSENCLERPALGIRKRLTLLWLLLSIGFTGPVIAGELAWIRQLPGCHAPAPTGQIFTTFTCGALGRFTFSDDRGLLNMPASACSPRQQGVEEPEKYGSIPTLPPITIGQPLTPCEGPACLTEQIPASGTWVAAVDWNDWHGTSVSWLIESLSGVTPVLFDLGSGAPEGQTSDVHVLRQLCKVVEHVEQNPDRAPAVVNMSFGRAADLTSYDACSTDMLEPPLSCMLAVALERLGERSRLMAAAGNHDTLLFPAASRAVQAVGGLDVAWFNHSGDSSPSWQSPDEASSLMPASSICIDDHRGEPWAAPPGTSWSSAILSAWVAASRPDEQHWQAGRWRPQPDHGGFLLASDHGPVPGSRAGTFDRLLERLQGSACSNGGELGTGVVTLAAVPVDGLGADPVIFLDRQANHPTPDPDPCLPCTGGWDDGPGGGGLFALEGLELLVDFTDSPGVPGDLELVGLRIVRNRGALLFDLVPAGDPFQQLFDQIERAEIRQLRITGLQEAVLPGDELAVVYLFRKAESIWAEGTADSDKVTRYWSATTVQFRAQKAYAE